jgi:hypothetical protein
MNADYKNSMEITDEFSPRDVGPHAGHREEEERVRAMPQDEHESMRRAGRFRSPRALTAKG